MPPAALPPDEFARLEALRSYAILDTAPEPAFDDLVALAARLTGAPIALLSLVDSERQWFKARHGLVQTEMPRAQAFCAHAILTPDQPLAVPDARLDPRFQGNPLVTDAPGIRAYHAVPLVNADGFALGTLCVIDLEPRAHDPQTIDTLRTLARAVTANLELRRSLIRVGELALTDWLTGLPNRRAVTSGLEELLARGEAVAVVAIDLDHFKETNDAEGHAAGDALLCVVAERLRAAVRPGDLLGRVGGDEFVACLVGVRDRALAEQISRRISQELHRMVPFGPKTLRLGATLGVAVAPIDAEGPELSLRAADEALMRTKRAERGGIGWASRGDTVRLLRAAAIVRAFDADAVGEGSTPGASVRLQPIIDLRRPASEGIGVVALEALARWRHPEFGFVPPDELLPIIGPERLPVLAAVVREQALAAFATLRAQGFTPERVALNLSAGEVAQADIAPRLAAQVERAGLSLALVDFEITEEVLLDRVSHRTLDELAALREAGARLMLDDFGTGNSGLAQLLRLSLDAVKLDKRFVQRLGRDARAEAIVRATVSLAHGLGMEVIAEGIETAQQASMVRALGCDAAQGFYYARPMALTALVDWLREHVPPPRMHMRLLEERMAAE